MARKKGEKKSETQKIKNKVLKRVLIFIGFLIFLSLLIIIFYLVTNLITKYTGLSITDVFDNTFEKCLKNQDITLYINSYNVEETLNSFETKDYFNNIKIFNCLINKEYCINNINYFPSWVINGEIIEGDIALDVLEEISGCEL